MMKSVGITTQRDLAKDLGVSPSLVSDFISEDHGTYYKRIAKFAKKHKVSVDWLLTGEEPFGRSTALHENGQDGKTGDTLTVREPNSTYETPVLSPEEQLNIDNLIKILKSDNEQNKKAVIGLINTLCAT